MGGGYFLTNPKPLKNMKKSLLLFALAMISMISFAKDSLAYTEPEFIGEVYVMTGDSVMLLEKNRTVIRTQASATMYIFGIGDVKSRIKIPNPCSQTRISAQGKVQLIVRANNNSSDPMTVINMFRFDQGRTERAATLSKLGTFSGSSTGTLKHIDYTAKKYGEASYLVTINNLEDGEYGITVTDSNATDGSLFISCLGVGDCPDFKAKKSDKKSKKKNK
jgi:hypothetical protein